MENESKITNNNITINTNDINTQEKPVRIIVTGGAGFIGSNLVSKLLQQSPLNEIIVLDNLSTGNISNVEKFKSNPRYTFINHDVKNYIDIPCNKIFHLACPDSPPAFMKDPVETLLTSVNGTYNMLQLAEKYNARFLFTSTSEIYDDPESHPQKEEFRGYVDCRSVRSGYIQGKRLAETLCNEYDRKGVWTRTARIFNTYGPWMDPNDGRVMTNFIIEALLGVNLTIYGSGEQSRCFTYIDDTVNALLKLIDCDYSGPVNIGNPYEEYSILDFANLIKDKIDSKVDIIFLDEQENDPVKRKPDISKARHYLGWEPKVSLDAGIKITIDYFREKIKQPGFKFKLLEDKKIEKDKNKNEKEKNDNDKDE